MKLKGRFIRWCPGAIGFLLRRKYYRKILGSCGKSVIFGRFINIVNPEKIHIGDHVILSNFVTIAHEDDPSQSNVVVLEDSVFIGTFTKLKTEDGGKIVIKKGANIGSCCHLKSDSLLVIGKHTLLAAYCQLGIPYEGPVINRSQMPSSTSVGDACWLGVRVKQYSGTDVGSGSIVGAHATINVSIPGFSIAVGQPAEVVRKRSA